MFSGDEVLFERTSYDQKQRAFEEWIARFDGIGPGGLRRSELVARSASAIRGLLLIAFALLGVPAIGFAETAVVVPPPTLTERNMADDATEKAVLAGGCFWGLQGVFQHVTGVKNAVSGYAGGLPLRHNTRW